MHMHMALYIYILWKDLLIRNTDCLSQWGLQLKTIKIHESNNIYWLPQDIKTWWWSHWLNSIQFNSIHIYFNAVLTVHFCTSVILEICISLIKYRTTFRFGWSKSFCSLTYWRTDKDKIKTKNYKAGCTGIQKQL